MNKIVLAMLMLGGGCGAAAPQAEEKPEAAATAAAGAPVAAAAAEGRRGIENPLAFVTARYETYRRDEGDPDDPAFAYSDRLRALFDAYEAWTAQNEGFIGTLDFDWWTNSQDWALANVRATETRESADRRIVSARFTNDGRPDEVRFVFVRQGSRWFLDDAISGTGSGDGGWTLSALLRERP
jgi:hypothetical protein